MRSGRPGTRRRAREAWTLALASALAAALLPLPARAQTPDWLFPERTLLPDLLAGPRDPVVKGQLVYADPNPTAYGPGAAGEVAISGTVPLLLLLDTGTPPAGPAANPRNVLVLGMEGAAFAHFSFAVVTRELVNTDWVFAIPLVWRREDDWLRLRYYHTSSHLGDEYQRRFGPSSIHFSRDGADLTAYLRPRGRLARRAGLGLYAGVLWSVNSHPEEGTVWRGRVGVELDPSGGALWHPYGALDVELEESSAHGARWTAQAGIWLPEVDGRPLRLDLELMAGPAAMGQLTRRETRRVALGLLWNP